MKWFATGAAIGVVGSFPLAALSALVFRFPVFMVGYMSGPRAVVPAVLSTFLFGSAGGFAVQILLGGLGGLAGARLGRPDPVRMRWLCFSFSLLGSGIGVAALAILDWVIGPW